ncbi:MAG: hypothetical protein PSV23_07105 [Brevundimonas sp.]|uniref:hypothetical protein n=1 Tax=Brevundimonas sp. TaxID=1871086 RepID=UPI002486EE77|nr:hypothetical protein [Brevundimonas sp.]MDI1326552.1 hypothetical protein [Brevundimonas sp.]
MNFDGFTSISFPKDDDIVYVLCFKKLGDSSETPFYVGESGRGTRRLGDYLTAQFAAPTDFKVGVVIKALQALGAEVIVKYRRSDDRKAEEKQLIQEVAKYYPLLNDESNFNYKSDARLAQSERFEAIAVALLMGTHPLRVIGNA